MVEMVCGHVQRTFQKIEGAHFVWMQNLTQMRPLLMASNQMHHVESGSHWPDPNSVFCFDLLRVSFAVVELKFACMT